jgi:hypothetical protein
MVTVMPSERARRSRTKNQHWVPQFYLRYFATPDSRSSKVPQVRILSKLTSDGNKPPTNVRNVCGKRYLYTPIEPNGQRNWDLDDLLGKVETLLGEIWPALAEDYVSLKEETLRKGVSLFVALMHIRNLEVRKEIERIHERIVNLVAAAPHLPDGTPDVKQIEISGQIRDVNLAGWHDYRSWGKNEHDRFFAHVVRSEAIHIANRLLVKRWSIVCVDEDSFITTDKPVALHHMSPEKFGFTTPDGIITFPIGPKRMLVMDDMHQEPSNQYYPLKKGNAGAFNLTTWRNGSLFMITGRPIAEVLNEILAVDPANRT